VAGTIHQLGRRPRRFRQGRAGFTLIEALIASALLAIAAAGITQTWSFCYGMNDQARRMQAGKNILEQEMERVRRLNWSGLSEQTSWATRYYYDPSGKPLGAPGVASAVATGFVSYVKVETLQNDGLNLSGAATVDTSSGNSRSLRRVTVRIQPTGVTVATTPATAEAVTFLTLGGP
jgi:prepilin-type N-terminal cleavage/methylation domain-containing protein